VRRVGVDYHVDIDAHYYSVPYRFARAEVDARLTARGVGGGRSRRSNAVQVGQRSPSAIGYRRRHAESGGRSRTG
jgi:hypothetical protein